MVSAELKTGVYVVDTVNESTYYVDHKGDGEVTLVEKETRGVLKGHLLGPLRQGKSLRVLYERDEEYFIIHTSPVRRVHYAGMQVV